VLIIITIIIIIIKHIHTAQVRQGHKCIDATQRIGYNGSSLAAAAMRPYATVTAATCY